MKASKQGESEKTLTNRGRRLDPLKKRVNAVLRQNLIRPFWVAQACVGLVL